MITKKNNIDKLLFFFSYSLPDEIILLLNTEDDLKDITNTGFRDEVEDFTSNDINIPFIAITLHVLFVY